MGAIRNHGHQPGEKRGRLTLLFIVDAGNRKKRGLFRCDCGREVDVIVGNWVSGNTSSCGCARRTHGQATSALYKTWENMKTRAKRVGMDDRWATFVGFLKNPPKAGPSPIDGVLRVWSPGLCLCRTNDTGPYSPENCRWDTRSNNSREQVNPTKLTPDQVSDVRARYAAGGITQTALGSELGVSKQIIQKACANNQRST